MAAPEATVAALVEYFKRTYSLPERTNMSLRKITTLRQIPRNDTSLASGEAFYEVMDALKTASATASFSFGMTDYTPSKAYRWLINGPKVMYGRITVQGLALAQSPAGALINVKAKEADQESDYMMERLEKILWGDGAGELGRIGAAGLGGSAATRVLTLAVAEDAYNFQWGQVLQANPNRTGNAGTLRADVYKVTGVNYVTGVVTADRISGAGSDWANNDYIYIRGDYDALSPGIPAFIPATDPTSTPFLGVDRSLFPNHLAGWRYSFQGSIEETIKFTFSRMGRFVNKAANRFAVCLSTADWYTLELELGARVVRDPAAEQTFGTGALMVRTTYGTVPVIAIPVMTSGRGYLLDFTTWRFHHLRGVPHVIDDDGNVALRLPAEGTGAGDGIEIRFRCWYHLTNVWPIGNATFATA
jgi:hypothetical protein